MANLLAFYFSSPIIIFEVIALLFSFFTLSRKNEKELRYFVPLLGIVCITEFLGTLFIHYKWVKNIMVYNIMDIITIVGYLSIIARLLHNEKFKFYIRCGMLVFSVFAIANLIFIQGFNEWTTYTTISGAIVVLVAVVLAFIEISNYPYQISLRREPLFWICCSMFVYFLPTAVMTTSYTHFSQTLNSAKVYAEAYYLSQNYFSLLHYGLLSYSVICRLIFPV